MNHLSNVLVTVSDRKTSLDTNTDGLYESYSPDVLTATDYAPFGSTIPGRSLQASSYRYGFNGKENDNEVKNAGDQLNFGARIYDSRLGRFLSLDNYMKKYPFESPFSFAANSPIIAIDQDGKFPVWTHYQMIYENLIKAKVDKKIAHEIALFGSTFSDHPTDWYIMPYNKFLAANYLYKPSRLNYNSQDYNETLYSQSDELISSVSLHGMRTWWEEITPEQAVNRSLYGGTYKELDGTVVQIKGAYEVINDLKGKEATRLTRKEKKALGQALHTIEDVKVHNGKRWVAQHEKEALKIGHKNEHPDSHEVPVNKKDHQQADKATSDAIKIIQSNNK